MKPISVAHVITKLDMGGAQQTVLETVRGLDPTRFTSTVFAGNDAGTGGSIRPELDDLGVEVVEVDSLGRSIGPRDPIALLDLRRELRRRSVDVVHTHSSKAGVLGRLAAASLTDPAIVHTVHGWSFRDHHPLPARSGAILLERRLARRSDRIFVVSERDRSSGLDHRIGTASQYRLVRSGVDLEAIASGPSARAAARRTLGLSDDDVVVGWVGRFDPIKGIDTLVSTVIDIARSRPDVRFVLVGSGPLEASARAALDAGPHPPRVAFTGVRTDVEDLWAAFDVVLLTSVSEGLPRTVVEALAAGVPVVGTDVGGVREVLRSGRNGFVVPVGAHRALALHAVELASGASTVSADPRDPELQRFSTRRMLEVIQSEYTQLRSSPRVP